MVLTALIGSEICLRRKTCGNNSLLPPAGSGASAPPCDSPDFLNFPNPACSATQGTPESTEF